MNGSAPSRNDYLFKAAALLFTLACIVLLVLKLRYPAFVDALAIALLALAGLPWIFPYLKEMKLPGGIEFAFKEKLDAVDQRLTDQQNELNQQKEILQKLLENLATYSISGYIYCQLEAISRAQQSGGEFLYRRDGSMWRNLRFLMDHGYIEEVFPEPDEGANISGRVRITEAGRDLIMLRQKKMV